MTQANQNNPAKDTGTSSAKKDEQSKNNPAAGNTPNTDKSSDKR